MAKSTKKPVIPQGYEGGGKPTIEVTTKQTYYPPSPRPPKALRTKPSKPAPMAVKVVGPVSVKSNNKGGKHR